MNEPWTLDRRSALRLTAGAVVGAALAGCTETAATYEEWGDVDELVLEARTGGWVGIEPDPIEGEANPTLVLYEGREYDLVLQNGDGASHSLELWDGGESVVDGHRTGVVDEAGETQTLPVRADPTLSEYVCGVHTRTLRGGIDVEPANDTDNYEDDG